MDLRDVRVDMWRTGAPGWMHHPVRMIVTHLPTQLRVEKTGTGPTHRLQAECLEELARKVDASE